MIVLAWILFVLYSLKTLANTAGIICGKDVNTRVAKAISAVMAGLVVYVMTMILSA